MKISGRIIHIIQIRFQNYYENYGTIMLITSIRFHKITEEKLRLLRKINVVAQDF